MERELAEARATVAALMSQEIDAVSGAQRPILLGRAAAALRASEERFRALVENSTDFIALLDEEGRIRYANQAVSHTLGHSPEDCAGQRLAAYAHPEDLPVLERLWTRAEQQPGAPQRGSLRLVARDQSERNVDIVLTNHLDNSALGVIVCNASDVTEQRRLQARLQLSDRMASVGTLAAGVAHEINNPLTVVVGNLDVLAARLARAPTGAAGATGDAYESDVGDLIRDASEAAVRIRNTVRDLKLFSRGGQTRSGPIALHPLLETSLRLTRNEVRHRARVATRFAPVPSVVANEGRLSQAFINLIVNAAQAIPEGHAEDNEIQIATFTDREGRAIIEISDSGAGLDPEVLPRIFDPFFAPQPTNTGTRLGLAICHEIISEHAGEISVESHLGFGTTFRVTLPPASDAEPAFGEGTPAWDVTRALGASARRARVLVIDDEPLIASLLARVLSSHYDVTTEVLAESGLARLGAGARFDVILCDLMMPQMSGIDLFRRVSELDGDQARRIVFMTGGAFTAQAQEFLKTSANPCLDKPIDARALRAVIEEVLA
jgi:PAS domain S-box-containing protein